ncbi:MAG: lipoyl synthase [Candidatus Aminicenantia bacterium]
MEKNGKPEWLKIKRIEEEGFRSIRKILKEEGVNTVCEEARCPNIYECWNRRSATFLILGDVCTRGCKFCSVKKGIPPPLSFDEPEKVAKAVKSLNLKYVVITSVTRDDLEDGGASIFARTVIKIKEVSQFTQVEVLIPDFKGKKESFVTIAESGPDIVAHNIEVPKRIYPRIGRKESQYFESLNLLSWFSNMGYLIKSGIMVGLGEEPEDIIETLYDISNTGCKILTIGQYLTPSKNLLPVEKYYKPSEFDELKRLALGFGFKSVSAGPFVRSSYQAETLV